MKANLNYSGPALTTEEWEHKFGISVQQLRLVRKMTQIELAKSANISIGSVQNLEAGKGSSLKCIIAVARALGRTDWLSALTPPTPKISPMELLRQREAAGPSKRRYKKKDVAK